jgi:hypothetical protein
MSHACRSATARVNGARSVTTGLPPVKTVERDSARIAYVSGDGPPVILGHAIVRSPHVACDRLLDRHGPPRPA